jgi:hypothetical protein
MATADVTDAKAAANYMNGAMGTVMSRLTGSTHR